jgi:hypothetical protein
MIVAGVDATTIALVTAGAGLLSGLVGAGANTWLANRSKVSEELREQRLKVYPDVWARTRRFSRWPRNAATYSDLGDFEHELRTWYYGVGGLYMSHNAQRRYGDVQELVANHAARRQDDRAIPVAAYEDIMDACSAFRSALTEDLESRRQGSAVYTAQKWLEHRRAERSAGTRLRRAAGEEGVEAGAALTS